MQRTLFTLIHLFLAFHPMLTTSAFSLSSVFVFTWGGVYVSSDIYTHNVSFSEPTEGKSHIPGQLLLNYLVCIVLIIGILYYKTTVYLLNAVNFTLVKHFSFNQSSVFHFFFQLTSLISFVAYFLFTRESRWVT